MQPLLPFHAAIFEKARGSAKRQSFIFGDNAQKLCDIDVIQISIAQESKKVNRKLCCKTTCISARNLV